MDQKLMLECLGYGIRLNIFKYFETNYWFYKENSSRFFQIDQVGFALWFGQKFWNLNTNIWKS